MHGGETLYACVFKCFHDDYEQKIPSGTSLARPDIPGNAIASIPWTMPECWRDRKLIITCKIGVTVTW